MNETELLKQIADILKNQKWSPRYSEALKSDTELTEFISDVIAELASMLGMFHFREYYTIDHVLYRDEDRIAEGLLPYGTSRVKGIWLKHICVAVEHENHLDKAGGFQELAKLMLINADLKVLMGWAEKYDNYDKFALEYQQIYNSTNPSEHTKPILFIGEYSDTHIEAYLIAPRHLMKYDETTGWQSLDSLGQ